MCTMIGTRLRITGSARAGADWAAVDEASVTFDHATRLWAEHALRLDLAGAGEVRASVELDLDSAKALIRELAGVVAAAERAAA